MKTFQHIAFEIVMFLIRNIDEPLYDYWYYRGLKQPQWYVTFAFQLDDWKRELWDEFGSTYVNPKNMLRKGLSKWLYGQWDDWNHRAFLVYLDNFNRVPTDSEGGFLIPPQLADELLKTK